MGIQKNEALVAEIEQFKEQALKMHIVQVLADTYKNTNLFDYNLDSDGSVIWYKAQARQLWDFWQAKAQAAPEGFVLIKASDRNREILELIDQRDYMEDQAEQLKDKLQELYGVDFGEHSNCNFPFQNAIDFDDSDLVLVPKDQFESLNEFKGLYKRAIINARKRKDQLNWAHVAGLGVGSGRAVELCKMLNIDPSATNMHEVIEVQEQK